LPAEAPALHLNAHGPVVVSARGRPPSNERVGKAALARALVAQQHHLDEVARRLALGQVAQELQYGACAGAHD